jgi:hypothetical protein
MCCLTCSYFSATEPPEHKAAREAGRCEGSCGEKWDCYTIFRYVQNHKEPLKGVCRFNPVGVDTLPWSACGQYQPVLGRENGWGIRAFDPGSDHSLMEWATKEYLRIRENKLNWQIRRLRHLEEMNSELRHDLAAARKRSAGRLARLKKLQNKKPKPEPKLQEPSVLRLVAAE